jgi:protein-tyrosine phosphatase
VERLRAEGNVSAVVCVQTNEDLFVQSMPFHYTRSACPRNSIVHLHVPTQGLDSIDQAAVLPSLVRSIAMHYERGATTYVHCSTGVNRLPLPAVGFLTFYLGFSLEDALLILRSARLKCGLI